MTAREPPAPAEAAFAAVAQAFASDPAVSAGTMFGSTALKARGRVFAMLVKGNLVVKLPRTEVDLLIAKHIGTRFDPGHGNPMREWVRVAADLQRSLSLARCALDYANVRQASFKRMIPRD